MVSAVFRTWLSHLSPPLTLNFEESLLARALDNAPELPSALIVGRLSAWLARQLWDGGIDAVLSDRPGPVLTAWRAGVDVP